MSDSTPVLNVAFYMFTDMSPLNGLPEAVKSLDNYEHIKGSIILSYEGINGMLAGMPEHLEPFMEQLIALRPALEDMPIKKSSCFYQHMAQKHINMEPWVANFVC